GKGVGFGRVVVAIGAIGLAGAALVFLRRRKGLVPAATGPHLEVLASKSLGGKTRVVWLGAGDRELVVAVSGTQTSLLGQWKRGEADRPIDRLLDGASERGADRHDDRADRSPVRLESVHDDVEPAFASGSTPVARVRGGASSAVSGIMRLRGKVAQLSDDVATGDTDADEQWARDILAATGGRR
ncbi:MAG TPA: flagellar biosynthetic protein FliO, partial [Kofleriaceae bacterium]|nr:flagellar biosynthetic protein FliO [Kofleriaceae bacterium]